MPLVEFPEMRLLGSGAVPPITLFGESTIWIPLPVLADADVPAVLVPMKQPVTVLAPPVWM